MNNPDSISIVLPVYNCETTILLCLKSLELQGYPIKEVILIDNASEDNSLKVVSQYKRRTKLAIKIIAREKNEGVGSSYNLGVKNAKSSLVVLMHSDCMLPTKNELKKLMTPFIKDPSIDLSAPYVVLPMSIWKKYNFWQKYLFANMVDVKIPSGNGQFECVKRETFLKIGGYDEKIFEGQDTIGGEDADFHTRLRKIGKVVLSDALVLHIHYIGKNFSLIDVLKSKKVNARSYGRFFRVHGKSLSLIGILIFLSKFLLAILPPLLLIYSFYYSRKLFFQKSSLTDPKIFLVPFLNIFLVYHDVFWMTEAFLYKKKVVT